MKKLITTLVLVLITLIFTSAFIITSTGIAGVTGSPGEPSCNNPGCHGGGFSANAGATITSVPSFTNDEFVPGTTYVITVQLAATGFNRYGFGCEILDASNNNASSGTMQTPGAGVKFLFAGTRKNAVHNTPKSGTGGASFSFGWTAPLVGDTATIYVAGNAVNFNGSTSGDFPIPPIFMQLKAHVEPEPEPDGISENSTNFISGVSVYPNPASGLTSISYFLSQTQNVSVQLINVNGKVIKEFIHETQSAGSHSHMLELQNITPGIYFVKISLNNQKVSQKLIAVQ